MSTSDIKQLANRYKWHILAGIGLILLIILIWLIIRENTAFDPSKYKYVTEEQRKFLDMLHADAKPTFYDFINRANRLAGVSKIQITSSYRTFEHQARLVQELGNMAAAVGTSPHNYGLAVDMVVWHQGRRLGNSSGTKAQWIASGVPALAKSYGMTWGGDFTTHPFDPVHFDLVKKLGVSTRTLMRKGLAMYGTADKVQGNKIPLSA
jgi:D-alanyl-D-alanine carboxypeptidase